MHDNSTYQEIKPKHEKLKKLIKLYYLHYSEDPNYFQKITYYPNYITSLNIYKDSKVTLNEFSRTHQFQKTKNCLKLLVLKFDLSREIVMKGAFSKVSIIFNPLGLNHFLDVPFSKITENYCCLFNHFGEAFDKTIDQVYKAESIKEKRDILDHFFCTRILNFDEKELINTVNQMIENSGSESIQEISSGMNISRKTLLRKFQKHLLHSPSEYKSIVKFRNTLNHYQLKSTKPNFTSLAYQGNYYDQSDLNFHFKNKTGLTPKQLLTSIKTVDKGLYWTMDGVPKVQSSKKK